MELEPITRQEKIIAGKDLEPVTRMEMFLKQYGGGGGGGSVPKPLTYDYMPEGYPRKSVQTVTLMEEQEVAFYDDKGSLERYGDPADPPKIVEGQTYTVNWDGTEYECVCSVGSEGGASFPYIGNLFIGGLGDDTGEPFIYTYNKTASSGLFVTLDTSATHTISVKRIEEAVTPMADEFLPANTKNTTVFYYG